MTQESEEAAAHAALRSADERPRDELMSLAIGESLKALYGAIQREPVPSRLLDLLEQLKTYEQKR